MLFDFLAVVVVLNVAATISLWQATARKPERLKREFTTALLRRGPITPRHQSPEAIGERFDVLLRDDHWQFFTDFADFAEVVNWWLSEAPGGSSWRLQELPDTELRLQFSDTPTFGRRYSIFHNQVCLGSIELSPEYKYSTEKPIVNTEIELEYVLLLHYNDITEFLTAVALHVCDEDSSQWSMTIESAMTRALWQTQHISEFGGDGEGHGDLRVQFKGLANWYFDRREPAADKTGEHPADEAMTADEQLLAHAMPAAGEQR